MNKRENTNSNNQFLGVWVDDLNCELYGNREGFKALADEINLALEENRDSFFVTGKAFKQDFGGEFRELREIMSVEFVDNIDKDKAAEIVEYDWKKEYGCQAVGIIIVILLFAGFWTVLDFIKQLLR